MTLKYLDFFKWCLEKHSHKKNCKLYLRPKVLSICSNVDNSKSMKLTSLIFFKHIKWICIYTIISIKIKSLPDSLFINITQCRFSSSCTCSAELNSGHNILTWYGYPSIIKLKNTETFTISSIISGQNNFKINNVFTMS